ncbi:MAG: zf-HC2 domain-containing protein [Candidatus Eisenbacteria bacterium]
MHLDEERLQRLLDGELPVAAEAEARAHLASCAPCRDMFATAAGEAAEVDALLATLDDGRELPRVVPAAIAARARAPRGGRFDWARVAAAMLVAAGLSAVAYALPGSPLPGWLAVATGRVSSRPQAPDAPGPRADPGRDAFAGVALDPGSDLVVRFTAPRAGARAEVRLVDGTAFEVRTGSGAATFTTGSAELAIDVLADGAVFAIDVPRTAPRIEIRLGGESVFLRQGGRTILPPGSPGAETREIFLGP